MFNWRYESSKVIYTNHFFIKFYLVTQYPRATIQFTRVGVGLICTMVELLKFLLVILNNMSSMQITRKPLPQGSQLEEVSYWCSWCGLLSHGGSGEKQTVNLTRELVGLVGSTTTTWLLQQTIFQWIIRLEQVRSVKSTKVS